MLPPYEELLGADPSIPWMMDLTEQLALVALLERLRPECAIEVGSALGGSLQMLSRYSRRVISCDIDPTCEDRLGARFPNVEFVAGGSPRTLSLLLREISAASEPLGLILIDGDHSAEGVQADIGALDGYAPSCPLYVLLHDSFNPEVRRGIREAGWERNPHVHEVDLDFVPGVLHQGGKVDREMWGGLALAQLRQAKRAEPLKIRA